MEVNTEDLYNEVMKKIEEISVSEIPSFYDEETLADRYAKDFSPLVKERGEEYFENGHIMKVCKHNNKYIAKVLGSNDYAYDVVIEVHDDYIDYSCTCPCTYYCKHEYAVLLAISNKEYEEVVLKKSIPNKMFDLKHILQNIPAEELKQYLLSDEGFTNTEFDLFSLGDAFGKYFPKQKYDYYYNNLYNDLVLNDGLSDLLYNHLNCIKDYLNEGDFSEAFKIVKAIINAYKDTDRLYNNEFVDVLPSIGMYLRIIYRKGEDMTVQLIRNWIVELERANYYGSYYLEDIIISIK